MDRAEYVRAVTEHKDRVHNFALWMLRHPDDARDVAQESLVRMWEHRSRIRPVAAGSWLLRTTHNLCLDHVRRRRARPDVPTDDLHAWPAESQPDSRPAQPASNASLTTAGLARAGREPAPAGRS